MKTTRTISIKDLRELNVSSWSVKDDSPRGFAVKYTDEVKVGDKVVIENYFTLITD